jgi:hypothetical protein
VTTNQAWFLIVCAAVTLLAGLGAALGSGATLSWVIAILGAVNVVLGIVLLRKASRSLP